MEQTESIDAVLEHVVYQNAESHWTVGRLETEGGDTVTVVGSLFGVLPGTPLTVRGCWQVDRKYGRQFRVESYRTRSPETLVGIERYLGSGLIPGVGPELARRIVERFGLDTLRVIESEPERLEEVSGVGPSRAEKISASWTDQRDIQDLMVFLRGHDIPTGYAVRIFKRYGKNALSVVRKNPYRLALDIWGIGFRTADIIAQKLGMATEAPERVEAGLLHELGAITNNGHLHAPEAEIIESTETLLCVDRELIEAAAARVVADKLVIREILFDRPCLSLAWAWEYETAAAARLALLTEAPLESPSQKGDAAIDRFMTETGIELADQQKAAIRAAARDKCLVITGGPGVGKTTLVRAITSLFISEKRRFALAAPTGRAAKRLSESTQLPAATLHRWLEFQPQSGEFARNPTRPLEIDSLIVDEASMLDIGLFRALVDALAPTAQLILVGDIDQLPSVGPGSVLGDVIRSGVATVIELTEIFRQASQSRIITNAHLVNRGRLPDLSIPDGPKRDQLDFFFVERETPETARDTLLEMVESRIPKRFGLDPVEEIQVLTPMHRGPLGTMALNAALQARLNPEGPGQKSVGRGERTFRTGDKVMQIKNDYEREVFNGDVGVIVAAEPEEGTLQVAILSGRVVTYERADLDQLVHAYAISVHKSQGSEYPAVLIPLSTQHYMMLQRNLLYTAMTRAKELVVLVGSKKALQLAVNRADGRQRWTYLAERIRHEATR